MAFSDDVRPCYREDPCWTGWLPFFSERLRWTFHISHISHNFRLVVFPETFQMGLNLSHVNNVV